MNEERGTIYRSRNADMDNEDPFASKRLALFSQLFFWMAMAGLTSAVLFILL